MNKKLLALCLSSALLSACVINVPQHSVAQPSPEYSLSNAVKWQTVSKEYPVITTSLYQAAGAHLNANPPKADNWVVIADVDETLLDNSEYQRRLELTGAHYSSISWADWVKEEHANAVPGAVEFVNQVLAMGGKMAVITNRPAELSEHTWANLRAVGFNLTFDNACLLGRTPADKAAVDGQRYINDKDLRREQVLTGKAPCFNNGSAMPSVWKQPAELVLQAGDNIEDIRFTTQENANIDAIISQQGISLLVLPNPMYGSW